jgi:hypothetical protein
MDRARRVIEKTKMLQVQHPCRFSRQSKGVVENISGSGRYPGGSEKA